MIIGQVLRRNNVLSEEQLQTALNVQKDKLIRRGQAVRLGNIIVELGYASEEEVVQAINQHYQLSVSSLSDNIKERISKMRGTFTERLPSPRVPIWLQLSITTIIVLFLTTLILSSVLLKRQKDLLHMQTVEKGTVSL